MAEKALSKKCPIDGADKRSRTADLLITNQSLYQLSYAGTAAKDGQMGRICQGNTLKAILA